MPATVLAAEPRSGLTHEIAVAVIGSRRVAAIVIIGVGVAIILAVTAIISETPDRCARCYACRNASAAAEAATMKAAAVEAAACEVTATTAHVTTAAAHMSATTAAMATASEGRRGRRKRGCQTDCANCFEFRHDFNSCFPGGKNGPLSLMFRPHGVVMQAWRAGINASVDTIAMLRDQFDRYRETELLPC
jgi:hypothetical protein